MRIVYIFDNDGTIDVFKTERGAHEAFKQVIDSFIWWSKEEREAAIQEMKETGNYLDFSIYTASYWDE